MYGYGSGQAAVGKHTQHRQAYRRTRRFDVKVLVTGHLGYVGTLLTPLLVHAGHRVTGIDTDLYQTSNFGELPQPVESLKKDIRDLQASDLKGYDGLIHLAGLSNDPLGDLDPQLTMDINHLAAVKLAELAKQQGIQRMVLASTCSVYGAAGEDWVDETARYNPVSHYAVAKMRMESDVRELADDTFSPVFLRAATVYGYSPRIRFDLVLNNLTAWAYTTGEVFLKSDGSAWRPLLHVEDMARAFVAALEAQKEQVHNQAFNIGRTEHNYRVSELADFVSQAIPDSQIRVADDAGADKRSYRVLCGKIKKQLPQLEFLWNPSAGAEELYAAYKTHGLAKDTFEGAQYQRVAHLKQLMAEQKLGADLRWLS